MKFMIMFTHTQGDLSERVPRMSELTPEELEELRGAHAQFAKALAEEKSAEMVYLDVPANAKTVHLDREGKLELKDGPYTTGPEFVGGYFIIEAESMDEAVEWAKRGRWLVGSNEVREIKELDV